MLEALSATNLAGLPRIEHGFFTRRGGVSTGVYASLNCGSGSKDDPNAVAQNRARVTAHIGAGRLLTAYQVHGTTALVASGKWPPGERPKADALVTNERGVAVGVLAADCAPVLFADAEAGVVGAAHAGWRGALAGICEAAIVAMAKLGAKRTGIHAAVGPCISPGAYEVGPEFRQQFLDQDPPSIAFFSTPATGARPHFDLTGYVLHRLRRSGVSATGMTEACTFARDGDFFSYRRSRVRNEADYGRQISAIVLT